MARKYIYFEHFEKEPEETIINKNGITVLINRVSFTKGFKRKNKKQCTDNMQ